MSSLEISGNNYVGVWARLRECYDNKRLIIQNHIKAIFDLPIVSTIFINVKNSKIYMIERVKHIKSKSLCSNCLRSKHQPRIALGIARYAVNDKILLHNISLLLHNDNNKEKSEQSQVEHNNDKESDDVICNHSRSTEIIYSSQILLSTVIVKIKYKDRYFVKTKALLDNGFRVRFAC